MPIFFGQFSSKKAEIFDFFKQIRRSPLPTAFLNFVAQFLQTLLQDPFALCLAPLATLRTKIFHRRVFDENN